MTSSAGASSSIEGTKLVPRTKVPLLPASANFCSKSLDEEAFKQHQDHQKRSLKAEVYTNFNKLHSNYDGKACDFQQQALNDQSNVTTKESSYRFADQQDFNKMRDRLLRLLSKVPIQVETVGRDIHAPSESSTSSPANKLGQREPLIIKYYNERSLSDILNLHFECSLVKHNDQLLDFHPEPTSDAYSLCAPTQVISEPLYQMPNNQMYESGQYQEPYHSQQQSYVHWQTDPSSSNTFNCPNRLEERSFSLNSKQSFIKDEKSCIQTSSRHTNAGNRRKRPSANMTARQRSGLEPAASAPSSNPPSNQFVCNTFAEVQVSNSHHSSTVSVSGASVFGSHLAADQRSHYSPSQEIYGSPYPLEPSGEGHATSFGPRVFRNEQEALHLAGYEPIKQPMLGQPQHAYYSTEPPEYLGPEQSGLLADWQLCPRNQPEQQQQHHHHHHQHQQQQQQSQMIDQEGSFSDNYQHTYRGVYLAPSASYVIYAESCHQMNGTSMELQVDLNHPS